MFVSAPGAVIAACRATAAKVGYPVPCPTTIGEGTWSKGWTHFIPLKLGSDNYYVAYNSLYGGANLDRINASGNGASTLWSAWWGKSWTNFVPFVQSGVQYFIAYNASTGTAEIDKVTGGGNSVAITEVWSGTWMTDWTHIVPVNHNGAVHLLFYRAATGYAWFGKVNANGQGLTYLGNDTWTTTWTASNRNARTRITRAASFPRGLPAVPRSLPQWAQGRSRSCTVPPRRRGSEPR